MDKANIKKLSDLKRLKIGETYEIDEWALEPEITEETEAKLPIKRKRI